VYHTIHSRGWPYTGILDSVLFVSSQLYHLALVCIVVVLLERIVPYNAPGIFTIRVKWLLAFGFSGIYFLNLRAKASAGSEADGQVRDGARGSEPISEERSGCPFVRNGLDWGWGILRHS
jgi:hypothetical protein